MIRNLIPPGTLVQGSTGPVLITLQPANNFAADFLDDPATTAQLTWTDTNDNPNEESWEIEVSYDGGVTYESVTLAAADAETYVHIFAGGPKAPVGDTFILGSEAAGSNPVGTTFTL